MARAAGWHGQALALAAALFLLQPAAPGRGDTGEAPPVPVKVNAGSVIGKIHFHYDSTRTIEEKTLRAQLTLTQRRPTSGLRRLLGYLPLVNDVGAYALDPLDLQRDVVRLRGYYLRSGFLHTVVRYGVKPSGKRNTFDLDFRIGEGPPLIIRSVAFGDSLRAPIEPPPDLKASYDESIHRAERLKGRRMTVAILGRLEGRLRGWWQDRGYAHATVRVDATVDSAGNVADLFVVMKPGPRATIGGITVEGLKSLDENVITRELPFKPGDPYSARELTQGQREVETLPIVRLAVVDVPDVAEPDSTVTVRVRVTEGKPRLLDTTLGYVSEAGLQSEASISHNNFLGGARTLTLSGVARPGWLALDVPNPDKIYRGALTLQQPYVFDRRLSFLGGPFIEYRDDYTGRSRSSGITGTLLLSLASLRSVALQYELQRRIKDYSLADIEAGRVDYLTFLALGSQGVLDSLEGALINASRLGLSITEGSLDNAANPRQGFVVRPAFTITVPGSLNTYEYARADVTTTGLYPVSRKIGLRARFSLGKMFPYGRSLPREDEVGYVKYLGFRDAAFTAGGADDVRGWGNRLLGPKYPDVRFRLAEGQAGAPDTLVPYAVGYVPIGGLARFSGTFEARLPFPGLGPDWGTLAFLDAGRVWTTDGRFSAPDFGINQEKMFYSAGAGVELRTVVGAVRLLAGYKLNPSVLDEANPSDALEALKANESVADLPRHPSHRWHLHLLIGASF